jgi:hypothetical protein
VRNVRNSGLFAKMSGVPFVSKFECFFHISSWFVCD